MQRCFSKKLFVGLLVVLLCLTLVLPAAAAPTLPGQARAFHRQVSSAITGDYAYEVVRHLAVDIGPRRAGTDAEFEAADYIKEQFEAMGYEVELQDFPIGEGTNSLNVIATKPGRSKSTVIVGAHMD